jgi:hypothetical protein
LRSIAISYIVAEQATEWLLTNYMGPVYHLLHLVYLHLSLTVEQSPPPPSRRSLWCARCKDVFSEAARSAKIRDLNFAQKIEFRPDFAHFGRDW